MKTVLLAAIILITVWLEANFLAGLRPFGVVPDPLIVVVIYAGLTRDAFEAVGMAVFGGLLLDVSSGADFGLRTAFYTVLSLVVMVAAQAGVDFENIGLVMGMTAGATVIFNLGVLVTLLAQHVLISWPAVGQRVLASVLLNLILVAVLRPLLVRLLKTGLQLGVKT